MNNILTVRQFNPVHILLSGTLVKHGAWSWPLTSNKRRGLENVDLYIHSPHTPSSRGYKQQRSKHVYDILPVPPCSGSWPFLSIPRSRSYSHFTWRQIIQNSLIPNIHFNTILPPKLCVQRGLFPWGFPIKICNTECHACTLILSCRSSDVALQFSGDKLRYAANSQQQRLTEPACVKPTPTFSCPKTYGD
jgi:hypothetical protein